MSLRGKGERKDLAARSRSRRWSLEGVGLNNDAMVKVRQLQTKLCPDKRHISRRFKLRGKCVLADRLPVPRSAYAQHKKADKSSSLGVMMALLRVVLPQPLNKTKDREAARAQKPQL